MAKTRKKIKSIKKKPLKSIIGWREWLALPDLRVSKIKAKVDTGARTSSLHADNMVRFKRRGKEWIRFHLHPIQKSQRKARIVELEVKEERMVKSSSGQVEKRPVVVTTVDFAGSSWPIELTLTNRDLMGFRMLLGREAIRNRFVVDVGRSFLADKGR